MEITVDGELFVACNECAFPVCRTCYEYERKEGSQACPQCKTRYRRIKGELTLTSLPICLLVKVFTSWMRVRFLFICAAGSPRVEGDEEEDAIDDLEHEFDYGYADASGRNQNVGAIPHVRAATISKNTSSTQAHEIPLLTYGEEVINELSPECSLNS